jgi:hypothetical protein
VTTHVAPAKTQPYEIRSVGDRRVEVVSESPLQFEAKGWQRALRSELRAAVARIVAAPGEVLASVYAGEAIPWQVDAENVLFYNVGTGAFARSAAHGLRFERVFGGARAIGADSRFGHASTYEPAPAGDGFQFARRAESLVDWDSVGLAVTADAPSASEIWSAMRTAFRREGALRVMKPGLRGGYFGLALRVEAPRDGANAAAIVKPFVDGVAAAFSVHDGADLDAVSRRVAERLACSPADVARDLTEPAPVLLGTQRLVVCRSRGVQWLPPDDRCVACELLVDAGPGTSWQLSGSLFVAHPSSRLDARS